jgi:serine/threonine protein kinase
VHVQGTDRVYLVHLDKQLGKGTFAKVYLGAREDTPNDLNFAIKVIKKEVLAKYGEKGERNLRYEYNILQRVKHENIIRLEEPLIQTPSNYYLIFELCNCGDLQNYLSKQAPLNEFDAQKLVYQIGQAMRQLNLFDIIHRDIKPQNILMHRTANGLVAKLADFGLSKCVDTISDPDDTFIEDIQNTVCGTPMYMAPEIYKGQYTSAADIWCCGLIFLELVIPYKRKEEKKTFFERFANGKFDQTSMGQ